MSKIYLNELAGILAEKGNIDRRTAQRFVSAVVAVIRKGLENDRLVKIKGLGTFKVIEVDARESINVNTGERLLIEGHSKLTFMPDNAMKELVNKPFSLFETVLLNEGVDFEDIPQDASDEDSAAEDIETDMAEKESQQAEPLLTKSIEEETVGEEPVVEEPVEEELFAEEPTEEEPTEEELFAEEPTEEEPTEEEPTEEEPTEEEPTEEEPTEEAIIEEESDEEDDESLVVVSSGRHSWVRTAVCSLLALAVGFAAGYFTGHGLPSFLTVEKKAPSSVVTASKHVSQQAEMPVKQQEPVAATAPEEVKQQDTTEVQAEEPQTESVQTNEPEWERYNNMSARTRDGAYYIMGLDRIVKARAGDDSKRIAKRVYGGEEMSCYIEVYNGITADSVLEAGREIKIPKIETKKSVRRRLQQQK